MSFAKTYGVRRALGPVSMMVAVFGFALSAHAAPVCTTEPAGILAQGPYILQNNMFGAADDTTGTQNICNVGNASNAWTSEWTWHAGAGKTKAFPSIYVGWGTGTSSPDSHFPTQVMNQYQIPTEVSFSVSGAGAYAVGYHVYFSPDATATKPSAEMQIWLNYSGMTPPGKKVYSNTHLNDPDESWDTWKGDGDDGWPVVTFVRTSPAKKWSSKLQPFVYCTSYTLKTFEKTWYTMGVQFGAMVVQSNGGKGSLKVSEFSLKAY